MTENVKSLPSTIEIRLDQDHRLISFDMSKSACGVSLNTKTGFEDHCKGKKADEIINLDFGEILQNLKIADEETQFYLYVEWDALRCALAQYLGVEKEGIDTDRCQVESIDQLDNLTIIREVVLPPKDLPTI